MNFKILASSYDRRWKGYTDRSLGFLVERLRFGAGEKILDVGCGTGNFESKWLSRGGTGSVTAVDPCVEMIEIARRKWVGKDPVDWQVAGVQALPFPDEMFDAVISANSFHYYKGPEQALAEIRRVLKPKGVFWLLDWCRDFWTMKALDLFLGVAAKDYHRCYSQSEIQNLLGEASFAVESVETRKISPLWGLVCVKGGKA
ncbi:MAG: class I SAM-dependent methyltransferase [Candidatus Omnitrophica bacterium]|nr:class I SAM-dependent methyltransferase [Candidatus Omnitrophota bacterium]